MKHTFTVYPLYILLIFVLSASCKGPGQKSENNKDEAFTFVYLTDIHLEYGRNAPEGFQKAIDTINEMNPDFVLTGGDLIADALGQSYERADSLYKLYNKMAGEFNMPVYNTMGNHEVFGLYESSGVDPSHSMYGEKMYEEKIGKKFYSFNHNGWQFMVLDAIGQTDQRRYTGHIDSAQLGWIQRELQQLSPETPIVLSVHIPFLTVFTELDQGALTPNAKNMVINNAKEVLEIFRDYNLKLVLQGHLHYLEDIYVRGTHFITSGAVSGSWWNGPRKGTEEGFLKVDVNGDEFDWEYVDYGWEAAK